MKKIYADLLLFLVAVIWGGGFIFVEVLLNAGMSAGMITMLRGVIFSLCTFALYFKHIIKMNRHDVKVGLIAGGTNGLAFLIQAVGQSMTSSSHSALITVTYVVFVPILALIFYRIKLNAKTVISVLICVIGAFLLVNGFSSEVNSSVLLGDGLVLLSACLFGLNIVYLGQSGKETHYGVVSFFMGLTLFGVSIIYMAISRDVSLPEGDTLKVVLSLLYLGLLSSTLCQILQVLCQRYTSPVSASLILTLEGFFGGIFSLFYGDEITWNLIVGGLLIIISVLVQEFDFSILKKKLKNTNKNG